jgi:hydrogenase expression/formation protein HypC
MMCLGIPGRLVEVYQQDGLAMGKVEFGGILKETCLAYTPEAKVGDYVIVHVGFAISQVDESEAEEIFSYLNAMSELDDPSNDAAMPERQKPPEAVP